MAKRPKKRRSAVARDLRTPKYRPRVVPNKKRKLTSQRTNQLEDQFT